MASLSHLSDEELRKKLKEYGLLSPVTPSTRNVLLKKLNHVMTSTKSSKSKTKGPSQSEAEANNTWQDQESNNLRPTQCTIASLSQLSDEQLQKKLKQYGILSPVTPSTRNVLLKKLNQCITAKTKGQSQPESSFASENRSSEKTNKVFQQPQTDTEILSTVNKNVPVRVSPRSRGSQNSISRPISKESGNRSRVDRGIGSLNSFSSDDSDEDESDETPVEESQSRRSLQRTTHQMPSINSPNNSNLTTGTFYGKKIPVVRKRTGYSPLLPFSDLGLRQNSRSNNLSPEIQYDTGSDSDIGDENDGKISQSRMYGNEKYRPRQDIFTNDIARRRLSDNSNFSPQSRISFNSRSFYDQNNLDFRSNFDTSYGGDKGPGEITSPDDIISQESQVAQLQIANGQSPFDHVRRFAAEHFTLDKEFWLPSVPLLLVVLLALFFGFLGLCYMSIHTPLGLSAILSKLNIFQYKSDYLKLSNDDDKEFLKVESPEIIDKDIQNKFPVCEDEVKANCLSKHEMQNIPDILGILENVILPALSDQAAKYQCGETPHLYVTVDKMAEIILNELEEKIQKPLEDIMISLAGLAKLTSLNPHWGVKAVWEEDQLQGFATTSYSTEILCHVTSAVYNLVYSVAAIIIGIFVLWVSIQLYKIRRKQVDEVEQKSFELVEQILEVLENSCGTGGKEFIAVNHVRDCLIAPRERMTRSNTWNKAVQFIDEHDSRVYREIRSVGGEDCEVWRWVAGAPRSPISCPKAALQPDSNQPQPPEKMWQGQAFESLETTQNVPQVSPTSCLKIRNMFDCEIEFGENWPSRIQDSLLEKCEGICITHVAVDKVSKEGCVYVKCSSAAEAGKAFRALHGGWFDGKLVTVKYLREERYFERFPTARISTAPLTPSNNKRLSLKLYPTLPPLSHSTTSYTPQQTGKWTDPRRGHSSKSQFGIS